MKRRHVTYRSAAARHAGFTLIEILIAITIIGILASIVLGALQQARETAKAAKTRSLVTRLHYIIMAKLDSYSTRRVSMNLNDYVTTSGYYNISPQWRSRELARARVNAIRDLMRLEMPDRWSDVFVISPLVLTTRPAVSRRYLRVAKPALAAHGEATLSKWGAAECLYMIVMNIPDAAEQFHASEIGDIDGDGLNEFHDGWGRPIRFIRWPSGFVPVNDAVTDLQTGVPYNPAVPDTQPDPFDPQCVVSAGQGAFPLYPLIYSAGPDGIFDINIGKMNNDADTHRYTLDGDGDGNIDGNLNPFRSDDDGNPIGEPRDAKTPLDEPNNGQLDHYDNIHNHVLESARER